MYINHHCPAKSDLLQYYSWDLPKKSAQCQCGQHPPPLRPFVITFGFDYLFCSTASVGCAWTNIFNEYSLLRRRRRRRLVCTNTTNNIILSQAQPSWVQTRIWFVCLWVRQVHPLPCLPPFNHLWVYAFRSFVCSFINFNLTESSIFGFKLLPTRLPPPHQTEHRGETWFELELSSIEGLSAALISSSTALFLVDSAAAVLKPVLGGWTSDRAELSRVTNWLAWDQQFKFWLYFFLFQVLKMFSINTEAKQMFCAILIITDFLSNNRKFHKFIKI